MARARVRPSSAAPGGGCRKREKPSLIYSNLEGDGPSSRRDGRNQRQTDRDRGISSALGYHDKQGGGTANAAACEARLGLSEGSDARAGDVAGRKPAMNVHQALEATMKAAIGVVPPLEQFMQARSTIAEMKKINTKDSTGDILQTTQVRRVRYCCSVSSEGI